jgi:hypothetical protein
LELAVEERLLGVVIAILRRMRRRRRRFTRGRGGQPVAL